MKTVVHFIRVVYDESAKLAWGGVVNECYSRFHIPISGSAVMQIGYGDEVLLERGHIYLIPPNVDIKLRENEEECYEHISIDFSTIPDIVNEGLIDIPLDNNDVLKKYVETVRDVFFLEYGHTKVQFEYLLSKPYISLMEAMIWYIFEHYDVKSVGNARVKKAIEFMCEHYAENISNSEIAANVYTNARYLEKLFKQEVKRTPHRWLLEYRVGVAMKMLRNGRTVKDVSVACGFNDSAALRLAFKKMGYQLPSEYKLPTDNSE